MTDAAAEASRSPLVTATVTNYNYEAFLPQSIESILGQSFDDFELLVIDNASTDSSVEVIRHYAANDERIRVIAHEENQGPVASQRESCALARGRYRVHIDADDWILEPDAFEHQVAMLEQHPDMSFVYSALTIFGPDEQRILASHPYDGDTVLPGEAALQEVMGFNVNNSGMMIRLDSYRQTAGYPDGMPLVDDILLAVRLCEVGKVGYVDRELYAFRQHGTNMHLAPDVDVIRTEILPVITAAFDGPLAARMTNPEAVRRRVLKKALVHLPTQYIFRNQYREGWRLYWESFKARPSETLLQLRTLNLALRTAMGERGYEALRSSLRRDRLGWRAGV